VNEAGGSSCLGTSHSGLEVGHSPLPEIQFNTSSVICLTDVVVALALPLLLKNSKHCGHQSHSEKIFVKNCIRRDSLLRGFVCIAVYVS